MRFFRISIAIAVLLLPITRADVRSCVCDFSRPETLEARECSLCKEVEKYPADQSFVFVRDANPTKPNRWLSLPRFHGKNPQQLYDMTPEQRAAYWKATIEKARELWGDEWGIATNSTEKRTQCHMHFHIGKLLPNQEDDQFVVVDRPEDFPVPEAGNGIWVHPVGARYHAHVNVPAGELKLQR